MPIMSVPRPLRERLGEEATDFLVELVNQATEQIKVDVIALAEERLERRLAEEPAKVRGEISGLRAEVKEDIAALHAKLAGDIASLDAKVEPRTASLETRMAALRADVIRWMFIFWIGELGAIVGILFAFFKT